ncbi:hypothetical protein [Streptomyces sp. NBC_01497]|uniref:hypothetical protein n=1 Tax=Streptomyces sp. NBC_01497 TaxID=2903885 RepID=UPI002E2FCAE8|nr:hypothetical protein [Streptomyces sp. NBC_01497]
MPADRMTLPPVRLPSEAELARDALAAPLIARAVRLARWAGPKTRVDAGGELAADELTAAAEVIGLGGDAGGAEGEAEEYAAEAWRVALETGLVEVAPFDEGVPDEDFAEGDDSADAVRAGCVSPGEQLKLVTAGGPQEILALWLDMLDVVLADAAAPVLDSSSPAFGEDGQLDFDALEWDPETELEFLDTVLGNLYQLTVRDDSTEEPGAPVPLPALAASVIVPDDMEEPTDDILEQVSEAMIRLDDQFRVLEPVGLVAYTPVDEALMADVEEPDDTPLSEDDVSRYGLVTLTPLGLYGLRTRLVEAGVDAPLVGGLAERDARGLLDGIAHYPERSAREETERWLVTRAAGEAASALLDAARGADAGAPLRRLNCQQALALIGSPAEPAVRGVLDDPELGGLARVWLAELGTGSPVPPPSADMVFWLTVDTIAAQLDAEGEPDELQELVEGLVGRHAGFFDEAWRVNHPATAEVLEAIGRLHPDRSLAKDARKAAFRARSRGEA